MENISPQRIPNTPCASLRPTHFSTAAAEFHLNGCGFAELGILNFLQDLLRKPSRLARIFRIASPAHLYEWYVGVKTNINIIYYITSINRLYIVSITIYIYIHIYWLVVSTPLKNMKVSWDDEIPNIWNNKSHVPNHQPDLYIIHKRSQFLTNDLHRFQPTWKSWIGWGTVPLKLLITWTAGDARK